MGGGRGGKGWPPVAPMADRPILRPRPPAPTGPDPAPATGGDDLTPLIVQADILRIALEYSRWDDLRPHCNGADPKTLDRGELVQLIVALRQLKRHRETQN